MWWLIKMGKNYGEMVKNTFLAFKVCKNKRKNGKQEKNTFGSQ